MIKNFLALPGRPECGVQLAWGFPPRSKWTYGEVFHPAVVPQPPFTQDFFKQRNRTLMLYDMHDNHLITQKYFLLYDWKNVQYIYRCVCRSGVPICLDWNLFTFPKSLQILIWSLGSIKDFLRNRWKLKKSYLIILRGSQKIVWGGQKFCLATSSGKINF